MQRFLPRLWVVRHWNSLFISLLSVDMSFLSLVLSKMTIGACGGTGIGPQAHCICPAVIPCSSHMLSFGFFGLSWMPVKLWLWLMPEIAYYIFDPLHIIAIILWVNHTNLLAFIAIIFLLRLCYMHIARWQCELYWFHIMMVVGSWNPNSLGDKFKMFPCCLLVQIKLYKSSCELCQMELPMVNNPGLIIP